jgi:hypothetical protein
MKGKEDFQKRLKITREIMQKSKFIGKARQKLIEKQMQDEVFVPSNKSGGIIGNIWNFKVQELVNKD